MSMLTMVLLVTSDNEQFIVEKDVAERSVLSKTCSRTLESDQPIPLPNFSSSVLRKKSGLRVWVRFI
ncbi:hypothetical protein F5148DRAFT_1193167 [Russula earlei]|uniref:Uncharacterized protein n=1 Tax=Russula earlei TaxID=71964 RepID=A0ACC0UCF5_9AGAM|nr:hypothetical protein F5148DRAFT_1193167 [Russula earlei]